MYYIKKIVQDITSVPKNNRCNICFHYYIGSLTTDVICIHLLYIV